jgi:hemerythrin
MLSVEWDPSLALGHAEIDRQHEEIFRRVAALVAAMESRARVDVERLFDYLGAYVSDHFAAEERVMTEARYPGAGVHVAAHARFAREYLELRALYESAGATHGILVKTRTWIEGWLRSHIAGADQALARHLRAR